MAFDMSDIEALDIDGLSKDQLRRARDKLFGPPPASALAMALAAGLREKAVEDLWAVYEGRMAPVPLRDAKPYSVTHANLMLMLRHAATVGEPKPRRRSRAVTGFTRWVHKLYRPGDEGSDAARQYGKSIERSIARFATPPSRKGWELIYRDSLDDHPQPLRISALMLDGEPIWGVPDLVFRHRDTGEVVIIERKGSARTIPLDGWPDLRAQLWCYAQMDAWRDAPVIRLVAEVWNMDGRGRLYRRDGGVLRWVRGESPFEEQNAALWARYAAEPIGEPLDTAERLRFLRA